ncbi:MAG: YabP/YqfC family sporulation protein [Eubacteriales bacterium]|nr:YabP/YqfC family sporulation protein [Eubacteriales bacterium]
MSRKNNPKTAKELLTDSLRLPRDMMLGASIVTAVGCQQVLVENYRGILEYTPESILLQGRACRIRVCGSRLKIAYYTNEDMKIEGKISEIQYL